MPTFRSLVTIPMVSANPKDVCVNTMYWLHNAPDDTDFATITSWLSSFYTTMRSHWPVTVNSNAVTVKFYNMSDDTPRAPVYEAGLTISGSLTQNPLPSEIAMCLSFQGVRISGVPQVRRRGRIFWGPCGTTDVASTGRPSSGLISDLAAAGDTLILNSVTDPDWTWVVNSADQGPVPVNNGWVDNAFDVQRRRGLAPLAKTTFDG